MGRQYRMRKDMTKETRLLTLFLSLLWAAHIQAFSNVDAKNLASDFYKSLAELSSSDIYKDHMATNKSFDVNERLLGMVLEGEESMAAPNETQIFKTSNITGKIYFQGYFNLYSDYARDHNTVLVNYEITNCEFATPPSREKDLTTRRYYYVQVRKEVKAKDTTWHLWDLVCIDGNAGKIMGIGNKTFGGYSPDEYDKADYGSIISHATWAYYKGDYDEAYNSYQQASWLKPNMCEPFYRMALMIYFKKGIKGRFKNAKERKTILKTYLYNAMTWKGEWNYNEYHQDAYNLKYILTNGIV